MLKASELIEQLQGQIERHGDLIIVVAGKDYQDYEIMSTEWDDEYPTLIAINLGDTVD